MKLTTLTAEEKRRIARIYRWLYGGRTAMCRSVLVDIQPMRCPRRLKAKETFLWPFPLVPKGKLTNYFDPVPNWYQDPIALMALVGKKMEVQCRISFCHYLSGYTDWECVIGNDDETITHYWGTTPGKAIVSAVLKLMENGR